VDVVAGVVICVYVRGLVCMMNPAGASEAG
jgi:hypothetical protein